MKLDWKTRAEMLERNYRQAECELAAARVERDRYRALLYEFAEFCRASGWHNVADELERRTRGEEPCTAREAERDD